MTHNHTGKTCPFCQFPIKHESDIYVCPECIIPHHLECWQENGKCTTFGCRGVQSQNPRSTYRATRQPEAERISLSVSKRTGVIAAIIIVLLILVFGLINILETEQNKEKAARQNTDQQ